MATTLTQRYVAATIKNLAPDAVDDVRTELEALIADATESRIEQGEVPEAAEHAVLTELGDPGILAAGYADRPMHLIGPRYYLTWLRLLKLLLTIAPVTAVAGVVLAHFLAGSSIGETVGQVFAVGISVVVHVSFWVTVVFVLLERSGADTGVRWSVDELKEPQYDGAGRNLLIPSLVFLGASAGLLLWDRFVGIVRINGEPLPVLDPGMWPWTATLLLVLIAAEAVLAILVYRARRWTTAFAVANTALAVLFFSVGITLLVRGDLFNPDFIAYAFTNNDVNADSVRTLGIITGFMFAGVAAWDIADGWLWAARAGRLGRR